MKEKIIDFSNGIFTYDQAGLKTEPQEIALELDGKEQVQGSFVISSCDERRIKGILHTRIPGLTLHTDSFFARAARVEYTFQPVCIQSGETLEDVIVLETSAGEYKLAFRAEFRREKSMEEPEELPLPELKAPPADPQTVRKGRGRSDAWKKRRGQEAALKELLCVLEKERRNACAKEEAAVRYRALADSLVKEDEESAVYQLLDVWVMLKEGRKEEAGWILRKYERTRLFQMRDFRTRALFLYVNSLYREEPDQISAGVTQLQKLYQKHPEDWMLTMFLLELDQKLKEKPRTRYLVLERQFRSGTRNRLLYQEAWALLKEDPALFTRLDDFTLQTFGWAAARGFLTEETALAVAAQSARLKKWSPLAARLLKACYQVNPSKETAGAVCAVYIRGHRTDADAFTWYQKGVELDAKITNLYEYFMYSLPENYPKLLPRQVLLYFQYHNTLTSQQKTMFYCNVARYGSSGDPACQVHERSLQEFLLKQLRRRRLNESLAWLYGRCLLVETLEDDLLYALADLLFLRKLTCQEKRIRQVEVSYEQLKDKITVPLAGGAACIPVYTPGAKIVLLDESGKRYRQTVPYDLKRVMIEPKFLQRCTERIKNHPGLNLYLLDGKGSHRLNRENIETAYRVVEAEEIKESYRQMLKVEILEYERRHGHLEKMEERLKIQDIEALPRRGQAVYIEMLILLKKDEEAFSLLQKTGCREVEPGLLLRLIQRMPAEQAVSRESLKPFARQVYEKGVYTEKILKLLAEDTEGSTEELLKLWKAARQFGMEVPGLEERIVVQALFTERMVKEVYPVFDSLDRQGGDYTVCSAYLNYVSWLDFVKGETVPEGLFENLEQHLLWEDRLADVAVMSYLKQISVLLLLTDVQKRLVKRLLKEPGTRKYRFAFMQKLSEYMDEGECPDDRTVVEYRCNPGHRVVLHYVLEYHGKKTFDYVTEQLFPVCGGVFTRSFILFYGERLTWFFTEAGEDGTSVSSPVSTAENREEHAKGSGRYRRLCSMQRALDFKQERNLKRMMAEYEELTETVEEEFRIR